jgi:hypothetical protein
VLTQGQKVRIYKEKQAPASVDKAQAATKNVADTALPAGK